uniref:MARVEL domain-containing protein n=1 Tax=Anopheles melas TaxID=34690 RepID=A0A182UE88_9DIPT
MDTMKDLISHVKPATDTLDTEARNLRWWITAGFWGARYSTRCFELDLRRKGKLDGRENYWEKVALCSLAVTCTTLHYYSFDDGDLVTGFLATGTFCGFIVILFTVMAGYLMKAHLQRRLSIFYSLLGCVCFLTSGVFIIEAWEHAFRTRTRDLAITKGSIAVINGVIFLMDTIFTFRERK